MTANKCDRRYLAGLVIGALGVVYGDIGTSPLYALRECFHGPYFVHPTDSNVLGVLSLIFWSLIIIVSIKYITFVMRADNNGEGGILALLSLAIPDWKNPNLSRNNAIIIGLGVFGAALLYGDGMITPAVSVLSAVEGLDVATPMLKPYIVPLTIIILIILFSFQKHGTGKVGRVFGAVTLVWFFCIALLGVPFIIKQPKVLSSFNPWHAVEFFQQNGTKGFVVLASVFLAVTGGEALYADMGHFGRRPIRLAWFSVVLPALMINYLGQGALLLGAPNSEVERLSANPFYNLAPSWALYPLVILATAAAVIASQALISGAFSLTMSAIQLGYCPRLEIDHTSAAERGQIYMPKINWFLMMACIGLVIGFGSSSNLAAAYGIAVTLTMVITTILFYFAAQHLWNWSKLKAGLLCGIFLMVEMAFCLANMLKVFHGGWFPLVAGTVIFILMATWKTGRKILGERLQASSLPLSLFIEDVRANPPLRVKGTAIFLSGNVEGTPIALLHNLKHNKVLHERVVILNISTADLPHVLGKNRVTIEEIGGSFFRVVGKFGFMEDPNVPEILEQCAAKGFPLDAQDTTFFLSRETVIPTPRKGMAIWRERLFSLMTRNAQSATAFFRIPPNRVVELGMQVEI